MDIQYFYMSDQVKSKALSINHCPTKDMLADFFIKPLHVSAFLKLHGIVMSHDLLGKSSEGPRSVLRSWIMMRSGMMVW